MGNVTILALNFFLLLMRTQQGEIGLCVVETFRIQHHDLRAAPFVLGMAFTTFLLWESAVKALMFLDICFYFLVAIRAQASLSFLVKTNVAFLAILFELGMPLDHFPGHQRGLSRSERDTGKRQG